jgi:hypothetical protein
MEHVELALEQLGQISQHGLGVSIIDDSERKVDVRPAIFDSDHGRPCQRPAADPCIRPRQCKHALPHRCALLRREHGGTSRRDHRERKPGSRAL